MRFSFLTLFPALIEGYFCDSILHRALEAKLFELEICNFRQYAHNRYRKVDSPQVGGGAGQVIDALPVCQAIEDIRAKSPRAHVIFVQPVGKTFHTHDAKRLAQKSHIVLVCGRYEGIDERAIEYGADELFALGDCVLTGGELPALMICDAICRQLEGVLGNPLSLVNESFERNLLESPQFSREKGFGAPPSEYSKGNHRKITALKMQMSVARTRYYRPDLYQATQIRTNNEKSIYRGF